jgi:two-component system cell cycle sensor histidine kinase/response regulator CckA
MPVMEGHRCLEELLKINPSVKIVIASGYSPNAQARKAIETGAKGFVKKPFDVRQMLMEVRTVLDSD